MQSRELTQLLSSVTAGRGSASVSVIEGAGAQVHSAWEPAADVEPAYLAYSITKTFIACLVLGLVERRVLTLDERVEQWFPRAPQLHRITIRQLLNHTSGIPDYGGNAAYHDAVRATPSSPWSFERFTAETYERGLLFDPGSRWMYSNVGYMLLKHIIERVTDCSFRTLIAERIARPLSLHATFVVESIGDLVTLAPGDSSLLSLDGSSRDVRMHYHPGWVSHGVVASTTSDIARFLDALFRGALLSQHSLSEMMQPIPVHVPDNAHQSPLRFVAPSYGLGLMIDPSSRWGVIAGHNGGGPAYSASTFHVADSGVTVCAMGAIEQGFSAEAVVANVLESIDSRK